MRGGGISGQAQDRSGWRTGLEGVTEARVAEDERRIRTCVEDSIEISGSSTAKISHTSVVCVREHSDESKTLIDTGVSPLVRNIKNCDLVCHLWQRSIIRWVASKVCVCVCVSIVH